MMPHIIMLHHVTDEPSLEGLKPYSISRQSFTRLLDVLEADSYTTTNFLKPDCFSGKKVFITFDDCPRHLWDFAIPELIKRNMTASFYMPTGYIDGTNEWDTEQGKPEVQLMNKEELQRLVDAGMELGSHSHRHIRLGDCSEAEVKENITVSKAMLEEITGVPVVSIAYPFGSIPANRKQLLQDAGYKYGLSIYSSAGSNYDLRRWIYHDGDDAARIKKKLSLTYRMMRAVKDKISN